MDSHISDHPPSAQRCVAHTSQTTADSIRLKIGLPWAVGKHVHKVPADVLWLVTSCDHSCYLDLPMILPYIARSCRTATVDFSPTMIFDSPNYWLVVQGFRIVFSPKYLNIVLAKHGRFSNSHHWKFWVRSHCWDSQDPPSRVRLDASPLSRAATAGAFHGASGVGGSGVFQCWVWVKTGSPVA